MIEVQVERIGLVHLKVCLAVTSGWLSCGRSPSVPQGMLEWVSAVPANVAGS
jgi:hypothetical protein